MWSQGLARLDFQLAYLVLLTRYGLKPLGRWEGPVSASGCDLIRSSGVVLDQLERRTRIGRRLTETVFTLDPHRMELYRRRFDGTGLKQTPQVVRSEGWFFGYPSCCVESFIRRPYAPNNLRPADQELLFHWACRDCVPTATLLRDYRRVYTECLRLFGSYTQVARKPAVGLSAGLARVAAASLVLVAGAAGLAAADDPHWLPVADDQDGDYLSFAEEVQRGTDWMNPDTDTDTVLDGIQTALLLRHLIDVPPPDVEVTEHLMYGLETCSICHNVVNMGFVRVTHMRRGLSVDVPFIALHYLQHGSLSFDGDIHEGRIDLTAAKQILFACDPRHLLPPMGQDPDEDMLLSEEEPLLGTDPAIPDTDHDSLIDGPQVAEGLLLRISGLPREVMPDQPYMQEHWMFGVEQCEICGITLNMGSAEIVNALENLSITLPFVGLHTLAHGGFVHNGTIHDGRVIPTVLQTVLTGDGTAHWIAVPDDGDQDGLRDEEEGAFGLDPTDPDENGDGIPDGRGLAVTMAFQIHLLPEGPLPDHAYVIHHPTLGFYNCVTCGEEINMGFLEIIDPISALSVDVPYYNLHFMDRGSFSTDRDSIYPRVDPREVAAVLGMPMAGVLPPSPPPSFAFWSAPNPFAEHGKTEILLSLPEGTGVIDVTIYDHAGRRVRELFTGSVAARPMRLTWNGCDGGGRPSGAGVYFCKVRIGSITVTRKLTLVP